MALAWSKTWIRIGSTWRPDDWNYIVQNKNKDFARTRTPQPPTSTHHRHPPNHPLQLSTSYHSTTAALPLHLHLHLHLHSPPPITTYSSSTNTSNKKGIREHHKEQKNRAVTTRILYAAWRLVRKPSWAAREMGSHMGPWAGNFAFTAYDGWGGAERGYYVDTYICL